MNDWIHQNTEWKTFKHSCGGIEPFIDSMIKAGFDILNPLQFSAAGMDPVHIKKKFGGRIAFWGGGINTQQTLPFGSEKEVRDEVRQRLELLAPGGGYIFNGIHNIQAESPVKNIVAMIETVKEFNKGRG